MKKDDGDIQAKTGGKKRRKPSPGTMLKKTDVRWIVRIVLFSVAMSAILTLLSAEALENAGYVLAFAVLAAFILLGILFDIIGVAVTAADEKPFHSMAAHKQPGAIESLRLIRNAEKVSSFCNDVVGDIAGIISGTTAAIIVTRLQHDFATQNIAISLAVSGAVSGIMIGGKALGKTAAINNSTNIVYFAGRVTRFFTHWGD